MNPTFEFVGARLEVHAVLAERLFTFAYYRLDIQPDGQYKLTGWEKQG